MRVYIYDHDSGEYAYSCPNREVAQGMIDYCVSQGDKRERYTIDENVVDLEELV